MRLGLCWSFVVFSLASRVQLRLLVDCAMTRQTDDPLALIPTIGEDDGDIPDLDGPDEDDDDEGLVVKTRAHKQAQATKGQSIDFNEQFQFVLVGRQGCCVFRRSSLGLPLGRSR